jgi:hypothetical protein
LKFAGEVQVSFLDKSFFKPLGEAIEADFADSTTDAVNDAGLIFYATCTVMVTYLTDYVDGAVAFITLSGILLNFASVLI